jgi:hypothetical protein
MAGFVTVTSNADGACTVAIQAPIQALPPCGQFGALGLIGISSGFLQNCWMSSQPGSPILSK